MADERDGRWLDEAAAEKLLRGEPLEPVGPAADPRARAEAARLRAALDSLARPQPPSDAQAREAAAMAAFRSARGARRPAADLPHAVSYAEPLIEIGHVASTPTASAGSALTAAPAFRRGRAVRFGLAAALASVTVGGLAAVAAAGLLGQERYDSAGPGPAMSVSVDEEQAKGVGSGAPTLAPKDRRTPHRGDGAVPGTTSGATQSPGASGRTSPGASATGGSSSGTSATGGPDGDTREGEVGGGGGTRETLGVEGDAKEGDREGQDLRLKAVDLCKDYRAGSITAERRERLSLLARGATRIPAYCESLLSGVTGGGQRGDSATGDGWPSTRTLAPASPGSRLSTVR
ncbi:hypothetical protein OG625_14730 [Streptomyces sp. NBC_01351]|uniref:hypothetical protein n=1 Tax=Streptomyces sp. NBC_01351 TaxID=2903833 RepID=UPI002E3414C9|nr:hypothetical protein [Streptomyces sp. NBC_01351]